MFGLDDSSLTADSILDCAAGASPFGAQVRARGGWVTSVDPIYNQTAGEIMTQVVENLTHARDWLAAHTASIDWEYLGSPDAYIRASQVAADLFAVDYTAGPEHYVAAVLPRLPFPDRHFTLTLSANLLSVNDRLGYLEHLEALQELVRVTGGEVRIHPVVDPDGVPYAYLDEARRVLDQDGIGTELRSIDKGWIIGGNQTLVCCRSH